MVPCKMIIKARNQNIKHTHMHIYCSIRVIIVTAILECFSAEGLVALQLEALLYLAQNA